MLRAADLLLQYPRPDNIRNCEHVMVLAPHPDDDIIGAGGVIALHLAAGANLTVVYLTDGEATVALRGSPQCARRTVRLREARTALAKLGTAKTECLHLEDGRLNSALTALSCQVAFLLDTYKPQIIYLPFFGDAHPDHRAVTWALSRIKWTAQSDVTVACYEIWSPQPANIIVDITDVAAKKFAALMEHRTALTSLNYLPYVKSLNRYRAMHRDSWRYAEAFLVLALKEYICLARQCHP
ncbi:MAG: PIG-L family deacetylase [Acidobacteria bacterium]|nr:PIG-L family deacetylase [Acidobacteriota bacterium]